MRTLLTLLLLFFAAGSFATSMVPVNLEMLTKNSEAVFSGEILSFDIVETEHGWAEHVVMRVNDPIIGKEKKGGTVSWVQMRLGPKTRFPGMPQFKVGEESLVFLSGKGKGTNFQAPFGLGQGRFRIAHDLETSTTLVMNEFKNSNLWHEVDEESMKTLNVESLPASGPLNLEVLRKSVKAFREEKEQERAELSLRPFDHLPDSE